MPENTTSVSDTRVSVADTRIASTRVVQLGILAVVTVLVVSAILLFVNLPDADAFNEAVVADVQMSGVAAPSTTRIDGKLMIRVNITNHRTSTDDLDILLDAVLETAERLKPDYRLS